jgi:hypothetical protein
MRCPRARCVLLSLPLLLLAAERPALAQSLNLRDLLPSLLQGGIDLAPPATGPGHEAHYSGDVSEAAGQFAAVRALNDEIGRQLSLVPLSSSAGGFSYRFDPNLGTLTRPTASFGSVYSDRPYTVGRGKYNLGVSFSRFTYDELDALDLRDGDVSLLFLHEDPDNDGRLDPAFEGDIITAQLFMNLDVDMFTVGATYGVTDRFDVGLAVPVLDVTLGISADAEVVQQATGGDDTHLFTNGTTSKTIASSGSRSGIGDVSLRGLLLLNDPKSPDALRAAVRGDVRFPTGDENNLLGSGAFQGQASLILSRAFGRWAWRASGGGLVGTEELPDEVLYTFGMDLAVDSKLTVSGDLLGRYISELPEVTVEDTAVTFDTDAGPGQSLQTSTYSTISLLKPDWANTMNVSVGLKLNVAGQFLVAANGLFPITDLGLRDDFSSLVGIDYSF